MNKFLKWTKILLVVVVVLTAALAIAVKIFVTPEKVKIFIEKKASESLHRQLKMESISLGFFSGLNITDFRVSERPDFSKGTFISSDRLHVRILWPMLLSKKIWISQFELISPHVSVVRYPDGKTTNFSDLTASPKENSAPNPSSPPAPDSSSASSFALLITQAKLSNGRLDFLDESPSHNSASLTGFNFSVRNFSLLKPIDFESSFKAKVGKENIQVKLKGKANDISSSNPTLDLDSSISIQNLANISPLISLPADLKLIGPLAGSVHIKGNLSDALFDADLNLSPTSVSYARQFSKATGVPLTLKLSGELRNQTSLNLTNYQLTLGSLNVHGKGSLQHLGDTNAPMTLTLDTNNFKWSEVGRFLSGVTLPTGISVKESLNIETRLSGNLNEITIESFQFKLGDAAVSGKGRYVRIPKKESLDLTVQGLKIPLGEIVSLVPAMKEYPLTGAGSIDARVSGSPSNPKIKGSVTLENASLQYDKTVLSQLNAKADFTEDSMNLPSLTGLVNGQSLKASLKASHLMTHPVVSSDLEVAELDLNKLISEKPASTPSTGADKPSAVSSAPQKTEFQKPVDVDGHIKIGALKHSYFSGKNFDLKWNLTNLTPGFEKLGGTSSFQVGPGELNNIQSLISGSTLARLLLMPVSLLQKLNKAAGGKLPIPSFDQMSYQTIVGDYVFHSGVATVNKFNLKGDSLNASMTGTAALSGSQAVDLKSTINLGSTVDNLKALNLTIKGTLLDPKVSLDVKAVTQQAIEAVKGGAADNLLKKFGLPTFGQHSSPPSESQANPANPSSGSSDSNPPQQNNSQNTMQDLGNLLKGILKK